MNPERDLQGVTFSWKRFLLILIIVLLGLLLFNCKQEDPLPYYEVVPVVEVSNAFFDKIYNVRLNMTLSVDGVETITSWNIPFKGVRFGCNLLKWTGEPVEYQAPTLLKFNVQVLYDVTGDGGGVLLENFTDGYLPKEATWIRVYFEVRDRYNPSNHYVGIEEYNRPIDGEYQAPTVSWQVTEDLNFVPRNQASSQSNLRIAEDTSCDCDWTRIQ